MDPAPLFLYLLPPVTLLALGLLGRTRRLGFWPTVLLSFVLSPVFGLLVAVASGPRRPRRGETS